LLAATTGIPCLHAQDETALRHQFEGRKVTLKIDMPGTADGVNVSPRERLPFDYQAYHKQLEQYGVAIAAGSQAVITKIKVKKNLIEVQLDGGGWGTTSDLISSSANGTSEQAQRELRARGGSRFNLRYAGSIPREALSPDSVKQSLASYIDFSPPTGAAAAAGAIPAVQSDRTQTGPAPVSASWQARVGWDHQIFPSYVIATGNIQPGLLAVADNSVLGDPNGQVAAIVKSPAAGTRVTVTVASGGLMEPTTFDAVLPLAGRSYVVAPTIAWDFAALQRNHQTRPASITVSVAFNGGSASSVVERVTLRSINDCPYYAIIDDGLGHERKQALWWMFAAYVNENHPFNDQLRREALDAGVVRNFTGYQTGDPQEVVRQVYAVWHALQQRGFRYSDITTTAGQSRYVLAQQVRFVDESMKGAQANCVDGSVLFASVLRQVGIDPVLVLIPSHMFVGFYLDRAHKQVFYLETTMLGTADLRPSANPLGLGQQLGSDPSWTTFSQAWETANGEVNQHLSEFNSMNPQYQMIDLQKARAAGILPIAYVP